MHELILASQSPRRKMILEQRGYCFRTFPIEVSEIPSKNLNPIEQISTWAREKAEYAVKELKLLKKKDILVLSADTVVLFDQRILGKPRNTAEAKATLRLLSGESHEVTTAYCLWDVFADRLIVRHVTSQVQFYGLQAEAIDEYVASGDCMDKAGAYGIQGKARDFVRSYQGSFNNIVGLPIEDLEETLQGNGWNIEKSS